MSARAPAFQFYPRDFVGDLDVAALSLDEVGAYTLLLCYSWLKGGLPNDHEKLSRALHVSLKKFETLWLVVGEKFEECEDGKLRNPRQEEERQKQEAHRLERSSAGRKGNAERWRHGRSAIAQPSLGESLSDEKSIAKHRSSSASADLSTTVERSPLPPKGGTPADAGGEWFEDFYRAYPLHKGPKAAKKAWLKLKPSPELREQILAAIVAQKLHRAAAVSAGVWVPEWPYPATWLNAERWKDELEPIAPKEVPRPRALGPEYRGGETLSEVCRHEPRCETWIWHNVRLQREQEAVPPQEAHEVF